VIKRGDYQRFLDAIELSCQIWGGAGHPLLPLDDDLRIVPLYRGMVVGAAVDHVEGISHDGSAADPVEYPTEPVSRWGDEFAAIAVIGPSGQTKPRVTAPVLAAGDPWVGIYAACLGRLPEAPSPGMIQEGKYVHDFHFEDHLDVQRPEVVGSLTDLLAHLQAEQSWSPRESTLAKLASGFAPNTGIRAGGPSEGRLPGDRYAAMDAGPNVVVVCTPEDVVDLSFLWNLRAAHSDRYVAPIGLPVDTFDPADLRRIMASDYFCRQGLPDKNLYVTSTSVPVDVLRSLIPDDQVFRSVSVVSPEHLASLGPAPSRHRTEVLNWDQGRATFLTVAPEDRTNLEHLFRTNLEHRFLLSLSVTGHEFPAPLDIRIDGFNQDFFAGSATVNVGSLGVKEIAWPSRLLMIRSVASQRGLDLNASTPGRVAMTFLESIDGIEGIGYLAHAPILAVLESMAQRQGTAWAKAHLREGTPDLEQVVAPSEDDLPEVTFDKFRSALSTTTATRNWLAWAERHKVVVKGFPITCENCDAHQWLPVTGFAPPVVCRGCGRQIERPFQKESLHFKYRLGEAARRVWEHDAMGHLLALRYLDVVFDKSLVGSHPGIDVSGKGANAARIGEADCLTLFKHGAVVPCEVKRSFAGVTDQEVGKLDALVEAFRAPWSFIAVSQYFDETAGEDFLRHQVRRGEGPHRVLLTFDHLLDPHPFHPMGAPHPTTWAPISQEARERREAGFVKGMEMTGGTFDPLEWDMMRGHD